MSKYVVVDFEMCNVPKGKKREIFSWKNEIIQIGAVLVNEKLEIADSFSSFVRPEYGEVDGFIEKLTGITKADTENAPLLAEALNSFFEWIPQGAIPVSWSDSDEVQLRRECHAKGLESERLTELLECWTDCQAVFGDKMDCVKCYNLTEALSIAGIIYDENVHNALTDARNTARLFIKMKTEPELKLSSYYVTEEQVKETGFTPFADLFANLLNNNKNDKKNKK